MLPRTVRKREVRSSSIQQTRVGQDGPRLSHYASSLRCPSQIRASVHSNDGRENPFKSFGRRGPTVTAAYISRTNFTPRFHLNPVRQDFAKGQTERRD